MLTNKNFISVKEAARILGLSREYVARLIKAGKIEGFKVGRAYVVNKNSIVYDKKSLTETEKKKISQSVDLTVKKYGPILKKLGAE